MIVIAHENETQISKFFFAKHASSKIAVNGISSYAIWAHFGTCQSPKPHNALNPFFPPLPFPSINNSPSSPLPSPPFPFPLSLILTPLFLLLLLFWFSASTHIRKRRHQHHHHCTAPHRNIISVSF